MDDEALLAAIAEENRVAMSVFFKRHHAGVFRFVARQIKSDALADEVANEVFLDVWRKAGTYEGRSKPTTWLFSMARFKAISALRKQGATAPGDDTMDEQADDADTPEVSAQKQSKAVILRKLIEQLPDTHSRVVDLIYYHEKTVQEVADILDIPPATVKTRMFNARKKLAEAMAAAGVDRGWP